MSQLHHNQSIRARACSTGAQQPVGQALIQPCKEIRPLEPIMPRRYAATDVALPCVPTPDILLGAQAHPSVFTQTTGLHPVSDRGVRGRLGDRAWSEESSRAVGFPSRAEREQALTPGHAG